MWRLIAWFFFVVLLSKATEAQNNSSKTYRNFPIILSLQFHSLSFPFKDLKTNFKNAGFGLGTEIALGSKHSWAQQFQLLWYRNKQAGNGFIVYTQSSWRPTIVSNIYTELKTGFGLTYNYRPVASFQQINGNWESAGHRGKWLFTVPVGISLGYNKYSDHTYMAPFVTYQILANANYAKSVPVITNSLLQIGTRIHLSNHK